MEIGVSLQDRYQSFKNNYKKLKQKAYNITHLPEYDAKQTDRVEICCVVKNPKTGKYENATLGKQTLENTYKAAKIFRNIMGVMLLCNAYNGGVHVVNAMQAPKKVPYNIEIAKNKSTEKEAIVWDETLPIPEKIAKHTQDPNSPIGKFYNSLKTNKTNLMKDLNINNETYNRLATVALKIAKEESNFGQSKKYKIQETIESTKPSALALAVFKTLSDGDGTLSLGLTKYKIAYANEELKKIFDKYEITYDNIDSNILEPEKSAIATIIQLSEYEKDYKKYKANVEKIKPDTTTQEAQKAILNAQNIIFNDVKRPEALSILTQHEGWEDICLENSSLTKEDLEDLRFYAKTITLSENAYLAARWNGKRVIPTGEKADIACKNVINTVAQKGYIANIDKTTPITLSEIKKETN